MGSEGEDAKSEQALRRCRKETHVVFDVKEPLGECAHKIERGVGGGRRGAVDMIVVDGDRAVWVGVQDGDATATISAKTISVDENFPLRGKDFDATGDNSSDRAGS